MYFNKRIHLLSKSIMLAALIRLAGAVTEGIIRFFMRHSMELAPDMTDAVLWNVQVVCSFLQICAIALIFYMSWKKLIQLKGLISEDEYMEIGRLQEEFLETHLSSLSAGDIGKLLQIWAVIMVGAECIYCVTSVIYRRFTVEMMLLLSVSADYTSFVSIYNMTHGFKYLEMLTAILLGVVMTGIFLDDRLLKIITAVIAVIFLLAFGVFRMQTIELSGQYVGIIWTSVIFHLTETIGLFILSLYLSKHYQGL